MTYKCTLNLICRIVFALLSIACMVMIFIFSCENGNESSDTSGKITEVIAENVIKGYHEMSYHEKFDAYSFIDHIIRKTAHFTIYMSLGFCVSCTISKRKIFSSGSAVCIGVCFIYACSDELHQFFVPERSCQFGDVLIDTLGSATGMIISLIAIALVSRISGNLSSKHKSRSEISVKNDTEQKSP